MKQNNTNQIETEIDIDEFADRVKMLLIEKGIDIDKHGGMTKLAKQYELYLQKRETQVETLTEENVNPDRCRIKLRQWLVERRNLPNIESMVLLCDYLGCSLDYVLGRIDSKTHDIQTVCQASGLSEKASDNLLKIQKNKNALMGMNYLLSDNDHNLSFFLESYCTAIKSSIDYHLFFDRRNPKAIAKQDKYNSMLMRINRFFEDSVRKNGDLLSYEENK